MGIIPRFSLNITWSELGSSAAGIISSPGPEVISEFEKNFVSYIGAPHALYVDSARSGLFSILSSIKSGRKGVILSAFNHPSIPAAILAAGLEPIFTDTDPARASIDPESISEEDLDRSCAVIITHLYGIPGPLDKILSLKERYGFYLIEDCAQSCGASYHGKKTGSFGDAAIFSFALTKNFSTLGGGMITLKDESIAKELETLLNSKQAPGSFKLASKIGMAAAMKVGTDPLFFTFSIYPALRLGYATGKDILHPMFEEKPSPIKKTPLHPPALGAALGNIILPRLDEYNKKRELLGRKLLELLKGTENIKLPEIPDDSSPIFMSFVIRTKNPGKLAQALLRAGFDTSPGYLKNCAGLPDFEKFHRECPGANELEEQQLHLPVYPGCSETDISRLARVIKKEAARQ